MERLKSRLRLLVIFWRPFEAGNRKEGKSFLSLFQWRKTSSAGVMRDETAALLLFRQIERFLEEFSAVSVRF